MMSDRMSKRASDDCVFADATKKKKISKVKRDVDVVREKPVISCNGNTKQKKAFFAYFGKLYGENKDIERTVNFDSGNTTKKTEVKNDNGVDKKHTSTDICIVNRLQIPTEKITKRVVSERKDMSHTTGSDFLKRNSILPFVSSFLEEFGRFPKITHTNPFSTLNSSDYKLHLNKETLYDVVLDTKTSYFSFQNVISVPEKLILEPYQIDINLPYMISSIKKSVPNFPVSDFHKYLMKNYLLAKKSKTDIESMWTDKYKPTCKEELLSNSELVKNLRNWLKSNKKKSKNSKQNQKYYDDDDFIFDSGSDSSHKAQYNLAILLGPSGCGKTSAVYALASELNANVIELNASCNRNGKRVVTDLMEATQSHAVEKNTLFNMIKEKKKKLKNVKKKEEINDKMTILLIEDADIYFENFDDGFLSAISTLATDSKRPLVLTANDPFSNHLLKFFLSSEMVFNFECPPKEHLNCFLQLMALNEGAVMTEEELNAFIHPFKPDIRQSILQLQFVLSTGDIDPKSPKNGYKRNINSIWWNWPFMVGCDIAPVEENKQQAKNSIDLATISQKLDSLSKLNLIYSKIQSYDFLDPQPFWHHLSMRDSASLYETHYLLDNSDQLSTDITQWIHNHINSGGDVSQKLFPSPEELNCRQRTWNISKNMLEQIGLDYCNRKNETCFDYLATIRSLGKNQQNSQSFGNLRNSKMFSYLRRINIDIDCKDLEYLCHSFLSDSNSNQSVEMSDQF